MKRLRAGVALRSDGPEAAFVEDHRFKLVLQADLNDQLLNGRTAAGFIKPGYRTVLERVVVDQATGVNQLVWHDERALILMGEDVRQDILENLLEKYAGEALASPLFESGMPGHNAVITNVRRLLGTDKQSYTTIAFHKRIMAPMIKEKAA